MNAHALSAADWLARCIFYAHQEAHALPYRSWDDLSSDERIGYRAAAVEALGVIQVNA